SFPRFLPVLQLRFSYFIIIFFFRYFSSFSSKINKGMFFYFLFIFFYFVFILYFVSY
ncbi:hypothetical protein GLOIN_2v1516308, partial [Rhizophagus irregularis DAOM 181602=DAOM 197198]